MADSKAEPPMPPGVPESALFDWLVISIGEDAANAWWKWINDTHPAWAREGWRRIDAARAACPPLG